MVERLVRNEKVRGSTPLGSTILAAHGRRVLVFNARCNDYRLFVAAQFNRRIVCTFERS